MSSVALPSSSSHWRLLTAGVIIPATFVALDHLLLDGIAGAWGTNWVVTLTMAMFIVQIGLMGVLCGRWTDLGVMRWVLYIWCWFLIDFQVLVAWVFTDSTSWWDSSFQPASLFTAQLGLLVIWSILGAARWTTRLPIAVVIGSALLLFLGRVRYGYENAAGLIMMQLALLCAICIVLRRKGFRIAAIDASIGALRILSPSDLRVSQFGMRDTLIWMTALALACGLVRWLGIPQQIWLHTHVRYLTWIPLLSGGVALSLTLVFALWAALGADSHRHSRHLALFLIPIVALLAAFLNWLSSLLIHQPWTAPWYARATWFHRLYWGYWYHFSESAQFNLTWLCLAGGMLFAALLFPRHLGYRLAQQLPPSPK